jgi:Asp-tRNA(Asn)/Glu-tRNA(Gln) amidotransferase A subunit family amidase
MPDDLHYLWATEALARFRTRELSPVELMSSVIARAEAVEPLINAFTYTFFDRAMEQAHAAEDRYAARGDEPRPLEGLPVALKDEVAVEGWPWENASLTMRDVVADHTAPVAERIFASGAIVHARSTTPEFSTAGWTHSKLWGITRNPWNPVFTPGGSSGGSGAALAAGSTTLASGSDIGGSIRIPAAFCGVVGFKPPFGRNPGDPPWNLDHYCSDGPMGRTVADVALFQNQLAGPHPRDGASVRPASVLPDGFEDIRGWRAAFSPDLGCFDVDPDVAANAERALEAFREAGATVEEVTLPWRLDDLRRAAYVHWAGMFVGEIADSPERREQFTAYAVDLADKCVAYAGEVSIYEGLRLEAEISGALGEVLDRFDVLVCPTSAIPGFVAGDDYVGHGYTIGDVEHADVDDAFMTYPFNICNRSPVLAVPSGFASNGVPTGIQIVGKTYDDLSVFRAGSAYERVRPWSDEHPTIDLTATAS